MRTPHMPLIPLLIVGAATMSLTLSGCVSGLIDGSIENGLESALEGQTGGELKADISGAGGAEVPAGWPAKVPLPPGNAITSAEFGGLFSMTFTLESLDVALAHATSITNAGFTVVSESTYDQGTLWSFTDGDLVVTYAVNDSGEGDGSAIASLSVQPGDS
jgi:hypothetical protein